MSITKEMLNKIAGEIGEFAADLAEEFDVDLDICFDEIEKMVKNRSRVEG